MKAFFIFLVLMLTMSACGSKDYAECSAQSGIKAKYCSSQTADEQAVLAMDSDDLDTAETLLEQLIQENPLDYFRYPRLSAVYAAQAGFDLLKFGQENSTTQIQGSSLTQTLGSFLPVATSTNQVAFTQSLAKMNAAKDLLLKMPVNQRTQGYSFYGTSAELQLIIYEAASSLMLLSKFTIPSVEGNGKIDPKVLNSITAADATTIINNLQQAAVLAEQNQPQIKSQIDQVVTQINNSSGSDEREKLIQYLKTTQQGQQVPP
jgi:hypothetical protein